MDAEAGARHTEGERIAALLEVLDVSRQLGATVELQPLLETLERSALKVLNCERATVFVYNRSSEELHSRVATGVGELRFSATQGIAGEVARTGEVVNLADAYSDSRFNPAIDRQTGFRTRNMLAFPLLGIDQSVVGVLQVLNKRGGAFDGWDEELVKTFGAQAGVALQRQLLLEEFAEKQRLQRDLDIARGIQQALLPSEAPKVEGFEVAGWNKPADETGGDCFDYLPLEDGRVAVTIADATGHGIGPALVIAECRAMLRATVTLTQDLAQVVSRVNDLLSRDLPDHRFVTAFLGLLMPRERRMAYLSAGHGPLFFFRASDGEVRELPTQGLPLGILPDCAYEPPVEAAFEPGDMLLLFTDGFFEWANGANEAFGTERLLAIVREHRAAPPAAIIEHIYGALLDFVGGTKQSDDLTAVIVKKT
jgi:sigma-B regulation protein RsbU (phosphoserine phosphatase)